MTFTIGVEESSEMGEVEEDILLLALKRVTDGLRLKAKSPLFEKFFSEAAAKVEAAGGPRTARHSILGSKVEIYSMAEGSVRLRDASLDHVGDQLMVDDVVPNLTFLRTVGLTDGVAFTIPCVVSIPQIENFGKAVQKSSQELFETYLRPFGRNVRVYVKTEKVA